MPLQSSTPILFNASQPDTSRRGHKNSPIVFDKKHRILFVIAIDRGILEELDIGSGALRGSVPTPGSPDDLSFDPWTHRLFVPGDGALNIYQIQPAGTLHLLQYVATGAEARTGIFLEDRNAFAVVVPATMTKTARVLIFEYAH